MVWCGYPGRCFTEIGIAGRKGIPLVHLQVRVEGRSPHLVFIRLYDADRKAAAADCGLIVEVTVRGGGASAAITLAILRLIFRQGAFVERADLYTLVDSDCYLFIFRIGFLVVMTMTPLAAREPYRAEAAAPLRTVTDSMSSGLMSEAGFPRS